MNIVKKLKLALLATSVMLFPKAGHTMDPDHEKPSVILALAKCKSLEESLNKNDLEETLLYGFRFNPFAEPHDPRARHDLRDLREKLNNKMNSLFGKKFIPNEDIAKKLDDLQLSMSPPEFEGLTKAIGAHLLDRIYGEIIDGDLQKSYNLNFISIGLNLSKDEIEQRMNAIIPAIVELDEASPPEEGVQTLVDFPVTSMAPTKEEFLERQNKRFSRLLESDAHFRSFFSELFEKFPSEIMERIKVITQEGFVLLPPKDNPRRFQKIESLLKLNTEDVIKYAESIKKLMSPSLARDPDSSNRVGVYRYPLSTYRDSINKALLLDTSVLKERVDNYINIINTTPVLKELSASTNIAYPLSNIAIKIDSELFSKFVNQNLSDNFSGFLKDWRNRSLFPSFEDKIVEQIKSESTVGAPSSSRSGPIPSSSGPSSSNGGPELEEATPSSSSLIHSAPTTFRTTGAKEGAEIKHSAIYASFSYQNNPDAAYSLIINHRTKDKGSEVRVFSPNTKTYIDLGRLSPSVGFSDQVFNLSSLFKGVPSSSSSVSVMRTELNFIDGISDIHSFTIKSGEERLMEVILGDEGSEKQTGVHVYAPELPGKLQEWSKASSEDVE